MEPAAAWGPSYDEFQQANWTVEEEEEEGAHVWGPAGGLPLEYASISDIFGTSYSLQPYVPESVGGQQQLVEYYNYPAAASQLNWSPEAVVFHDGQNRLEVADPQKLDPSKVSNYSCATDVFNEVEKVFNDDVERMEQKMHRYPVALRDAIDKSYTVPRVVAIGPYHHNQPHLKPAETVKHMAAIRCVKESEYLLEEIYAAVDSVVDDAWRLYDKDATAGLSRVDFRDMMFVDACFLVQYFRRKTWGIKIDESLASFLVSNGRDINHDVILLENQLPWKVVETVMDLVTVPKPVHLKSVIRGWEDYLVHRRQEALAGEEKEEDDRYLSDLVEDDRFKPHLLGLLRYYIVGRDSKSDKVHQEPKNRLISISANELAEIGISLKANKTMKLIDMSLNQEGTLLGELSLAPLALDRNRASLLFNMAALELCTVESFSRAEDQDSAVCSYLLLLALLVCREEDVQELRATGLLQGGGGLTDDEAFRFFASFQGLRFGRCYNRVLADIEHYREKAKLYPIYYKNKKTIDAVASGLSGAFDGIIGSVWSIIKKAI